MSLDGMWKFWWIFVFFEWIMDFYCMDFNDKDWKDFLVFVNWEINGYGMFIYVLVGYLFKIDFLWVMGEFKVLYIIYKECNLVG